MHNCKNVKGLKFLPKYPSEQAHTARGLCLLVLQYTWLEGASMFSFH